MNTGQSQQASAGVLAGRQIARPKRFSKSPSVGLGQQMVNPFAGNSNNTGSSTLNVPNNQPSFQLSNGPAFGGNNNSTFGSMSSGPNSQRTTPQPQFNFGAGGGGAGNSMAFGGNTGSAPQFGAGLGAGQNNNNQSSGFSFGAGGSGMQQSSNNQQQSSSFSFNAGQQNQSSLFSGNQQNNSAPSNTNSLFQSGGGQSSGFNFTAGGSTANNAPNPFSQPQGGQAGTPSMFNSNTAGPFGSNSQQQTPNLGANNANSTPPLFSSNLGGNAGQTSTPSFSFGANQNNSSNNAASSTPAFGGLNKPSDQGTPSMGFQGFNSKPNEAKSTPSSLFQGLGASSTPKPADSALGGAATSAFGTASPFSKPATNSSNMAVAGGSSSAPVTSSLFSGTLGGAANTGSSLFNTDSAMAGSRLNRQSSSTPQPQFSSAPAPFSSGPGSVASAPTALGLTNSNNQGGAPSPGLGLFASASGGNSTGVATPNPLLGGLGAAGSAAQGAGSGSMFGNKTSSAPKPFSFDSDNSNKSSAAPSLFSAPVASTSTAASQKENGEKAEQPTSLFSTGSSRPSAFGLPAAPAATEKPSEPASNSLFSVGASAKQPESDAASKAKPAPFSFASAPKSSASSVFSGTTVSKSNESSGPPSASTLFSNTASVKMPGAVPAQGSNLKIGSFAPKAVAKSAATASAPAPVAAPSKSVEELGPPPKISFEVLNKSLLAYVQSQDKGADWSPVFLHYLRVVVDSGLGDLTERKFPPKIAFDIATQSKESRKPTVSETSLAPQAGATSKKRRNEEPDEEPATKRPSALFHTNATTSAFGSKATSTPASTLSMAPTPETHSPDKSKSQTANLFSSIIGKPKAAEPSKLTAAASTGSDKEEKKSPFSVDWGAGKKPVITNIFPAAPTEKTPTSATHASFCVGTKSPESGSEEASPATETEEEKPKAPSGSNFFGVTNVVTPVAASANALFKPSATTTETSKSTPSLFAGFAKPDGEKKAGPTNIFDVSSTPKKDSGFPGAIKPAVGTKSSLFFSIPSKDEDKAGAASTEGSSAPSTSQASGFSFSKPASTGTSTPNTTADAGDEEAPKDPQIDLTNMEEEKRTHDALVEIAHARLQLRGADGAFTTEGSGRTVLLRKKEDATSRSRLLMKTRPGGRVLINGWLLAAFKRIGKKSVQGSVMTSGEDGATKPKIVRLNFSSAEVADSFAEASEAAAEAVAQASS